MSVMRNKQPSNYQLITYIKDSLDLLFMVESIECLNSVCNKHNIMMHWDEFEYNEQLN